MEKENRETNVICFARKGPKPKDEDADLHTTRRIIGNLRATVMEGSFGNQKLHYGVGRIAARNKFSENLLLFFGIHMTNAATLVARELAKEEALKKTQPDNVLHILFIFRLMVGMNCYALMLRTHGLRGYHECKNRVLCRYSVHL